MMRFLHTALFLVLALFAGASNHDTIQVRVTHLELSGDTVYFVLEGRAADTVNGHYHLSNLDLVFTYQPASYAGVPVPLVLSGYDSPLNHFGQPIAPYDKSFVEGKYQAEGKFAIGLGLPLLDPAYYKDSIMVFTGTWTQLGRYALVGYSDPAAVSPNLNWITAATGLTSEVYGTDSLGTVIPFSLDLEPFGDFPTNGVPFDLQVFLGGPYNATTGLMSTALNSGGFLPLSQPYGASPWNYAGSENVSAIPNSDVVDWVLVEVRQAINPGAAHASSILATRAGFLLKDGRIVDLDGTSLLLFENLQLNPGLNTYTVVRHRNHLPIMSANALTFSNGAWVYDYTSNQSNSLGAANAVRGFGNGKFGMFSGDANGNGQIQTTDKNLFYNTQVGLSGYRASDFNLNGQVQTTDKNLVWIQNVGKGSQVP